jgi:hypothetical protein
MFAGTFKNMLSSLSKCLYSALHNTLHQSYVYFNITAHICNCFFSQPFIWLFSYKPCHLKGRNIKPFYNSYFSKSFLRIFLDSCTPESKLFSVDNCSEHISPQGLFQLQKGQGQR